PEGFVVTGPNGSGKTAIGLACLWCEISRFPVPGIKTFNREWALPCMPFEISDEEREDLSDEDITRSFHLAMQKSKKNRNLRNSNKKTVVSIIKSIPSPDPEKPRILVRITRSLHPTGKKGTIPESFTLKYLNCENNRTITGKAAEDENFHLNGKAGGELTPSKKQDLIFRNRWLGVDQATPFFRSTSGAQKDIIESMNSDSSLKDMYTVMKARLTKLKEDKDRFFQEVKEKEVRILTNKEHLQEIIGEEIEEEEKIDSQLTEQEYQTKLEERKIKR
ncbi:MAG: hypothetical protein OIF32_05685, partial [Campylobacterales bacterium]|nr:hypothetical protein [Campylobacterales bacterium]